MKKIKILEEAQIDGYDGAFLREYNENGAELATGWWNYWYSANAVDEEENEYTVYWEFLGDYNDEDNEEDACDWDCPVMILDNNSCNVIGNVIIE